jgi:hypothetical protein
MVDPAPAASTGMTLHGAAVDGLLERFLPGTP